MTDTDKWICEECSAILYNKEIDKVPDPRSDEVWSVCPECRTPEHIVKACDAKGCNDKTSCGMPYPLYRYIHVCSRHVPDRDGYEFVPGKHLVEARNDL